MTVNLPFASNILFRAVQFRVDIPRKPSLQLLAHLLDSLLMLGLIYQIVHFLRIMHQIIKFVRSLWVSAHILPFLRANHTHRAVFIVDHHLIPEMVLFSPQNAGKAFSRHIRTGRKSDSRSVGYKS